MRTEINLKALMELDGGRIGIQFRDRLKQLATDCANRYGDDTARVLIMEVRLTPKCGQDGFTDKVDMEIRIKSKIPADRTPCYECLVHKNGALSTNDLSREDVDQMTMDEA